MLAAIPQSPTFYSPYDSTQYNAAAGNTFDSQALLDRQHYILQLMATQGYITKAQADAAAQVNVLAEVQPAESKYGAIQDPYFVLAAKQQLQNQFGSNFTNRGGLKVITTLNTQLQNYAVQDVANNARNVSSVRGDQEAMVAENVNTGQVVAMVGGENFNNPVYGQINYANTNLSPGSSMKPFLYAALIQNNTDAGAGSVLYDSQGPLPGYPCTDKTQPNAASVGGNCLWDDNFVFPGPETIRYALAGSRNVPAVKASYEIDPTDNGSDDYVKSVNSWLDLANKAIGVKGAYGCYPQNTNLETATVADETQCFGSAAIGAGDLALDNEVNGDATFARLGNEIPQTYITKITDAANKVVYQWTQPKGTQVYKPDTAYIINSILDDPKASYLNSYQKFQNYNGWNIAVKTGTENQEYNGVMTAWSTQYAVIGFAGYHTLNQPLVLGHFEDITEPLTRTWMQQALDALHIKPVNWTQPTDLKVIPAYIQRVSTGFGAQVPGPTNELFPSWYAGKNSGSSSQTLDKVSGFIATSCTPALAKETVGGASDSSFSIDTFYPTKVADEQVLEGGLEVRSASQTDNVHNCNDSPPSVQSLSATCTSSTGCSINVSVTQGTHPLSGGTYNTSPASTIVIQLNGQTITNGTITIPADQTGSYQDAITYTPTATVNNGILTASVIDSVLYQSTTVSQTLNYTAPSTGPTGLTYSGGQFSWTGGTAPYNVTGPGAVTVGGNCTNVSGTSCTPLKPPTSGLTYTVTDANNATSTYLAP
jgi:penicillin-binding protein 1A